MNKDKKLYPGDEGYPGGTTYSTVVVNGKAKQVTTIRDENGNIVYTSVRDKIFGIF